MTTVYSEMVEPYGPHQRVGSPPSAIRVGCAAAHGINHVYAYLLGGVRILQHCHEDPTDDDDTLTYEIHRHPLCDHIDVDVRISSTGAAETDWVLTVQAGAGTPATARSGFYHGSYASIRVRAPWDSGDSGLCKVTITYEHLAIRSILACDVPRQTIDPGEGGVHGADSSHPRVGPRADCYIAASDEAGPEAMVAETKAAWAAYRPQIYALGLSAADAIEISAGSWEAAVPDIRYQARSRKSTTATVDSDWVIYSCVSGGAEYDLRISSDTDSVTETGLDNAGLDRVLLSGLAIDAQALDTITVEAQISSGTGTITIQTICGILEADEP